ncbi:MurR/RpiR family transcriptional regulator [Desulfovirgula thermocuniculi]|uniref:MurR/RpiR family transcriptional regulator n=1 Tax=Desulfovirgula thermocuniculi TaxID=348842 RepID=UPI0006845B9D|nr:MurR/RpiR family transcriptional regulator [Desulfovirgula thermocuniculi]
MLTGGAATTIMEIIAKLKENLPRFTKSQRLIAEYLLAHPDRVAFLTASRLARELRVSESTVVRFAIALGYDGYADMQKDVQEIIRNRLTTAERMNLSLGNGNILDKVINNDIQNLKITLEEISREDFEKAVSAIYLARRIYVVGLRSAAALAHFFAFYLQMVLKKPVIRCNPDTIFENLISIDEQDLVIGISFHRYTKQTVEFLKLAKEKGAKTMAITDSLLSPLITHADAFLLARTDINSFIDSFVAPLSIINALIVAISERQRDETLHTLAELESIWSKVNVYEPPAK